MAAEGIGKGQPEETQGVALCSASPLWQPVGREMGKRAACLHSTSTGALLMLAPAVPPNTEHSLVQNKKRQTDIHFPAG